MRFTKAQIKMFENVGVMIVFFFLLSFGLVFYTTYQKNSIYKMDHQFKVDNALKSSKRVIYMPELRCTETKLENCVDYYKLNALVDTINNGGDYAFDYYYNIFGKSVVLYEQLYPNSGDFIEVYSNPLLKGEISGIENTIIPVSLYNSVDQTYAYGVLNITIYLRK